MIQAEGLVRRIVVALMVVILVHRLVFQNITPVDLVLST